MDIHVVVALIGAVVVALLARGRGSQPEPQRVPVRVNDDEATS